MILLIHKVIMAPDRCYHVSGLRRQSKVKKAHINQALIKQGLRGSICGLLIAIGNSQNKDKMNFMPRMHVPRRIAMLLKLCLIVTMTPMVAK